MLCKSQPHSIELVRVSSSGKVFVSFSSVEFSDINLLFTTEVGTPDEVIIGISLRRHSKNSDDGERVVELL